MLHRTCCHNGVTHLLHLINLRSLLVVRQPISIYNQTGISSLFETGLSCEGPRFACNMTIIERTFEEPKSQVTHNKDRHDCTDCGLVVTGKRKLRDHIRIKHSEGYLTCSQCHVTFATMSGLNYHVRHVHQKLARYRCETCGKAFSNPSNYHDHVATHTGVKRNVLSSVSSTFYFQK